MSNRIQLQILAPQARVTELTDALLSYEPSLLFSTSLLRGYHHLKPHTLSAKEQVLGYQNAQLYLITLNHDELEPLFDFLREALSQANLPYQVIPVLDQGRI